MSELRWAAMVRLLPVILACSVLSGCGGASAPPSAPSRVLHQEVRFALPSDEGALVSVPLQGGATIVDAWSPSCVPCREKVPALVKRREELEAAGGKIALVAVLADGETTEAARTALTSWGVSLPFLVDRGAVLRRELAVETLPTTVVLDERGKVRWVAPANATVDDAMQAARAARETH